MTKMTTVPENYNNIHAGIVELLGTARSSAARNINSIMTATYWESRADLMRKAHEEAPRRSPGIELSNATKWNAYDQH